jgi:transketolase
VLPNMTVIVPADAPETAKVIVKIAENKNPTFVRIGRSDVPTITAPDDDFEIGRAPVLRDGTDITLVGTGIMVSRCLLAAEELKKHKIDARVINMSTIKPLDEKMIVKAARETGAIITAEEHSILEGLGSAVAMTLGENASVPMRRVGIPDTFGESGDCEELMAKYGLTAENIVEAAHEVLSRKK